MSDFALVENFLPKEIFDHIKFNMLGCAFPWYYNDAIVPEDKNLFQFVHVFYSLPEVENVISPYHKELNPVYDALGVKKLIRVKANLNVRTDTHYNTGFHIDFHESWNCKTAILYINTNNGWTEFENGDKVDSVENRLVTFDSQMKHAGNTATDQKIRVLINFNYE